MKAITSCQRCSLLAGRVGSGGRVASIRRAWELFLSVILIASTAAAADTAALESEARPNIILIVSDDQGYHDLGCLSDGAVKTPALDRLVAEGVRLTDFYVAWPACTPSRAALLTGRYPQRNGMYDMVRNEAPDYGKKYEPAEYAVTFERIGGLDEREVLLPELLQAAGYRTGIFGKWDLGSLRRYLPVQRGFDEFYGFVNTGIDYFTHERYGVPSMYRNETPTTEDRGVCSTELFRREALRFIDQNFGKPFFLYLPFNAPHNASNLDPKIRGGAQASERFLDMYGEFDQAAGYRDVVRYGRPALAPNAALRTQRYRAAVSEMDAAIGDILQRLDELQLTEKTLVIFFSDNGGSGGADNSPLRGRKAQMWEGGIRVPCILRWPSRIPAGKVSREFLTSLEVLPTVLAAADVLPSADVPLDGFNLLPTVAEGVASPRTVMFWKRRSEQAVRAGDWKWVSTPRGGGLFHLKVDVGETTDLSKERPDKVQELRGLFQDWKRQMDHSEPRGPFRDY